MFLFYNSGNTFLNIINTSPRDLAGNIVHSRSEMGGHMVSCSDSRERLFLFINSLSTKSGPSRGL